MTMYSLFVSILIFKCFLSAVTPIKVDSSIFCDEEWHITALYVISGSGPKSMKIITV